MVAWWWLVVTFMAGGYFGIVAVSLMHAARERDAIPFVRCKECIWWDKEYRECTSPNWLHPDEEYPIQPSGMYCGWGEKDE